MEGIALSRTMTLGQHLPSGRLVDSLSMSSVVLLVNACPRRVGGRWKRIPRARVSGGRWRIGCRAGFEPDRRTIWEAGSFRHGRSTGTALVPKRFQLGDSFEILDPSGRSLEVNQAVERHAAAGDPECRHLVSIR